MPSLVIDNAQVEVPPGCTILDAAGKVGIDIPTMCHLEGFRPGASCMVCVVKVIGRGGLVPACATAAEDRMRVETDTREIRSARKDALELLLSDHLGDCIAPCQLACPAGMDIPLVIRRIAAGKLTEAAAAVRKDIALPGILARLCPAPCERACRRGSYDKPVSICLLKRFVVDVDSRASQSSIGHGVRCVRTRPDEKARSVAVIGAGPTGLSAAYGLLGEGYACTIFDEHALAGGMLRYGLEPGILDPGLLDAEIGIIGRRGAEFQMETTIGPDRPLEDLLRDFDAVAVAAGPLETDRAEAIGLPIRGDGSGSRIDRRTHETGLAGVFAAGVAPGGRKQAVRAVAEGKAMSVSIGQYLSGRPVTGRRRAFSVHVGRLKEGEIEAFLAGASRHGRCEPSPAGMTGEQARDEATRCLHCDCRKSDACRLRILADACGAKPGRYQDDRGTFRQDAEHPEIIYEPGKCISCGLCIQIAEAAGEPVGLTFMGRGFDIRVAVPFGRPLAEGLTISARQCAAACPTGALSLKDES